MAVTISVEGGKNPVSYEVVESSCSRAGSSQVGNVGVQGDECAHREEDGTHNADDQVDHIVRPAAAKSNEHKCEGILWCLVGM